MKNLPIVLVVEDDKAIVHLLTTILNANDYKVLHAGTGRDALSAISSHCPDVVLLDLGLEDMDGVDIIRNVRQWSRVPIIVLSARNREKDKVEALDLGADDYVTKPFGTAELLARIRIAMRHATPGGPDTPSGKVSNGALTIDYDKRRIYVEDREIHLTQIEYKIVMLTMLHIGKVLTYDFIIRSVWGARPTVNNQILRVNMANIRRKIEANPADPRFIITETGVGYRMIDHSES
ncbi:MAG: response regulator transcription factor [Clostridia bacterium]|nr:response regulator transcription factor [Clostridia bacterium]